MATAYVGLGSNLGNREHYLRSALEKIAANAIVITNISSIYETEPVGVVDQPSFLNMVIEIETTYSPIELLDYLQAIETECERQRNVQWGPRTLDLDILLYNQVNIKSDRLEVPHPRMKERGFVLIPLYEINAQLVKAFYSLEYKQVKDLVERDVKMWKRKDEIDSSSFLKE